MSLIGGIQNFLSGGANQQAEEALNKALAAYSAVNVPTEQQLTLPQLQQYVQAGMMTPAQAEAVLQKNNAMNSVQSDPNAKAAEMAALKQLQDVASSGGMDATEKARLADTQSQMNQTLQGQRSSVLDQMAARGIPTSLMGTAAQLAFAGQDAEQAHKDALQANADAQTRALAAMAQSGQLGGQIESQNFGEQAQKATSQNAIDQWNAANQTNVNLANQQARQQAGMYNNEQAQNVSNANTQNANARTQYNAQLPQQIYSDQMAKAEGMAGVNKQQADQYSGVAKQNMATSAGLIKLAKDSFGAPAKAATGGNTAFGGADSSAAPSADAGGFSDFAGTMLAAHGGKVPGSRQSQGTPR
jgi:hypothetical protein